jgi:pimeloyl-ACP methyl ester carboxylesterase
VANNPLTYLGPYTYLTYVILYNGLVDSVDEFSRFTRAESDPYSTIHFTWSFARNATPADFRPSGEADPATLETLSSSFFTLKDPAFLGRGKTRSARIPATKRDLKFTYWLQPKTAPLVYIIPGLGSHRLAQGSLALAELVHQKGYSAVCVSGAFNSEFMENAATVAMPAYLPADGHDLHEALTEIDKRLQTLYPHRFGGRAVMGYSMGALHSMYIASTETTNASALVAFDRYVAIDTPVRMLHGVSQLDELYRAPLRWSAPERMANIENTFAKVAEMTKAQGAPKGPLPFSAIESQFLIGLTFRMTLKDIIFSSQRRNNQGVLRHSFSTMRRKPLYDEILKYSYQDYFEKFAIPYYQAHGLHTETAAALEKAGDLRTYTDQLRGNSKIRVIVNRNDFLLSAEDLAWLQTTFGPESLTVFDQGGHLGNLATPPVQQRILESLEGLKQ